LGDVRLPGTYQTSGQIHLADAVHLAGGLAPDAQTADAQIFRYLPDGKFKIFSVSLSQALGGESIENIVLQPRDRLLIHKNPDAIEPATVYKHVPMMESNVQEAVKNNVLALVGLLDLADQSGCRSFVMIFIRQSSQSDKRDGRNQTNLRVDSFLAPFERHAVCLGAVWKRAGFQWQRDSRAEATASKSSAADGHSSGYQALLHDYP